MRGEHARVALYGTDAVAEPCRVLRAGPLEAELEAGNLRHLRAGSVELIRAVSFIVRDEGWGTYDPEITGLSVTEAAGSFRVEYEATCRDGRQALRYRAAIEGAPERIVFSAEAEALTEFATNRAGFVVLHPIAGVAGEVVEVEHVDGTREQARFPWLIEPYQPFMDIRALVHAPAPPGFAVSCRMEGDTFEMEDQRNWTDASYKTYVRPIGLPWPFTIPKGERFRQSVAVALHGAAPAGAGESGSRAELVVGGSGAGPGVPRIGLAYDPDRKVPAALHAILRDLGARHLRCRYDPGRTHDARTMAEFAKLAEAIGAELVLEAVLPTGGPLREEAGRIAAAAREAGLAFRTVFVSPAPDLRGTLPGSPWPECPKLEEVYAAMRAAFPGARLGGGTYNFFTELNRKRPLTEGGLLDLVTHATCATVHAADDVSVMETIECLPAVIASAQAIAGGAAYHIGPGGIGLRANPYGADPAENPASARRAMAHMDPRQRGLFGAAWHIGFLAQCARHGVPEVTLASPVGEFGVAYAPMPYAQPFYDEMGKGVYPLFHVLRAAMRASGRTLRQVEVNGSGVEALAWEGDGGGVELWVANLTSGSRDVSLSGLRREGLAVLDAAAFQSAAVDPAFMDRASAAHEPARPLRLGPYAVARLVGA
jgi:D-apionolactonase